MHSFWKALLIIIPLGGYLLYKKSSSPSSDTKEQSQQRKENKTTSQSPSGKGSEAKRDGVDSKGQTPPSKTKKEEEEIPTEQIIERLSEIDGVTSRVAENLVEKGIYTREALTELSRDELLDIKGIGPKRAEKILGL